TATATGVVQRCIPWYKMTIPVAATLTTAYTLVRRDTGKDDIPGLARTGIRDRVPGIRDGQLGRGIAADAVWCLIRDADRTGTRDEPDRVVGIKTVVASRPGLRGIPQGGAGVDRRGSRGIARIL